MERQRGTRVSPTHPSFHSPTSSTPKTVLRRALTRLPPIPTASMRPPAQPALQRDGAALTHTPHARRGDKATIISVVDHWIRMLVLRASIALHREALLVVATYARVVSAYKAKRVKEGEQSADESEDTPLDEEGEDILAAEQLCLKVSEDASFG